MYDKPQFFTKKPVMIQAMKWTGDNLFEIVTFISGKYPDLKTGAGQSAWESYKDFVAEEGLLIKTLEGEHLATVGDWIIKGVKGEFYPCKPDIFHLTYDPVLALTN